MKCQKGEGQTFELNSNEIITVTIKNRIRVYFVCNQILRETNRQLFSVFHQRSVILILILTIGNLYKKKNKMVINDHTLEAVVDMSHVRSLDISVPIKIM